MKRITDFFKQPGTSSAVPKVAKCAENASNNTDESISDAETATKSDSARPSLVLKVQPRPTAHLKKLKVSCKSG